MADKPTYAELEERVKELEKLREQYGQAEKSIRENEKRYGAIVKAFDGLIYVCSEDYRVEYMNEHFIRRTGYDATGELCYKALHDRETVCPWCVNEKVFRGETVKWEIQSPKDNRWYYVVNTPIFHDGDSVSKQSLILDITDRKQAEAELKTALEGMEKRVAERTRDLETAVRKLKIEIDERRIYQDRLRALSSEIQLAEERERRRIARDLHDSIGQTLAITKMKLDQLGESVPDQAEILEEICGLVDSAISGTRFLTFEISPNILYELGLEAALEWLTERIAERHGMDIEFNDDGCLKPLNDSSRFLLFRAARELLFNVVKHAQTNRAGVSVSKKGGNIRIEVRDDGEGFDPARLRRQSRDSMGFGIFSIRERLDSLGGYLSIESQPGGGSVFTLVAPLSVKEDPECRWAAVEHIF